MSGAWLLGWLAFCGVQTLLVLRILSARQQRVTRVAGANCHSVGVAAAKWLEPEVNAGVCGKLKSRKHLVMASGAHWRCLCFGNK